MTDRARRYLAPMGDPRPLLAVSWSAVLASMLLSFLSFPEPFRPLVVGALTTFVFALHHAFGWSPPEAPRRSLRLWGAMVLGTIQCVFAINLLHPGRSFSEAFRIALILGFPIGLLVAGVARMFQETIYGRFRVDEPPPRRSLDESERALMFAHLFAVASAALPLIHLVRTMPSPVGVNGLQVVFPLLATVVSSLQLARLYDRRRYRQKLVALAQESPSGALRLAPYDGESGLPVLGTGDAPTHTLVLVTPGESYREAPETEELAEVVVPALPRSKV